MTRTLTLQSANHAPLSVIEQLLLGNETLLIVPGGFLLATRHCLLKLRRSERAAGRLTLSRAADRQKHLTATEKTLSHKAELGVIEKTIC
eukprot:5263006-Pleurochrysis_carterae.AAC.3